MNKKIFTIIVILIVIFLITFFGLFLSNGAKERIGTQHMQAFLQNNSINTKRAVCTIDQKKPEFVSCMIAINNNTKNEKFILQCPNDFWSLTPFGAKNCKELRIRTFQ